MITGAIFDVDGTILDSMSIWDNAGEIYLGSFGIKAESGLGKKMFAMSMDQGAQYLKEQYHLTMDKHEIICGINNTIKDFYENQVLLKPGIKQFLEDMKHGDIPMAIATSSDRCLIEKALERLGILSYFARLFTCSEIGAGKDKPDIYLTASRFMQSEVPDTWVFEDALHALLTAKGAGFKTAALYDESSKAVQAEIKEISDIYLDEWMDYKTLIRKIEHL